jgi:N-terminal acetyltransferase B complex non-catalytic subunit
MTLDVKQIQYDSVSYLFSEDLEFFGEYGIALMHFRDSMVIYDRNEIETPDMLIKAFQYGTFSKIPEFVEFRDKVRHSLQRSVSQRQMIRIELLRKFSSLDEMVDYLSYLDVTDLQSAGLTPTFDNRDKSLLCKYTEGGIDLVSSIRGMAFPQDRVYVD